MDIAIILQFCDFHFAVLISKHKCMLRVTMYQFMCQCINLGFLASVLESVKGRCGTDGRKVALHNADIKGRDVYNNGEILKGKINIDCCSILQDFFKKQLHPAPQIRRVSH